MSKVSYMHVPKGCTTNVLDGLRLAEPAVELSPWDMYFRNMANMDIALGREDLIATKSYTVRKAPYAGSYCNLGGLIRALRTLTDLELDHPDYLECLRRMGNSPFLIEEPISKLTLAQP